MPKSTSVHLSNELQKCLHKLKSRVVISSTSAGTLPDRYSFVHKQGRCFSAAFALNENSFSIVLLEKTDNLNYDNCFARGLFSDINRLAYVIDWWVDKQEDILLIKLRFEELELFSDFVTANQNSDIKKAWRKVRNTFFNDTEFGQYTEWKEKYWELLNIAMHHKAFENYFPFTSHYWLRFSPDKDLNVTWDLNTYIVPTVYNDKDPLIHGKYYVSFNDKPLGGMFFETAKEALDFYAGKLKEVEPTNWQLKQ